MQTEHEDLQTTSDKEQNLIIEGMLKELQHDVSEDAFNEANPPGAH